LDVAKNKVDTAWSQLLEASVNRDADVSIIVFDVSLADASILSAVENVGYVPNMGFICVVDSLKGDYSNLSIAYMLARTFVLNSKPVNVESEQLKTLVARLISDIKDVQKIRKTVEQNIENNKEILRLLEKSVMNIELNHRYLEKFLDNGEISKQDMLDF